MIAGTTDYEGPTHREYSRGRRFSPALHRTWNDAFAQWLPARRPLHGLDLGSGTGRFSPSLAEEFGPVVGVEPAAAMRRVAETESTHPGVRYLAGSAERIPAADDTFDYCLMFLVWHHVTDRDAAAREIVRVLRPGGTLLCRTQFSDLLPDLWWRRHFPRGREVDAAMYRPLAVELAGFEAAGLVPDPGLTWVDQPSEGTKRERLEALRTRTVSSLARMPDEDVAAGFASLAAEVAADPDAPAPGVRASMLVLRKPTA